LRNSPLIKGARGLFEMDICSISKKVAAEGSLIYENTSCLLRSVP